MKTNNQEFVKLKYCLWMALFVFVVTYLCVDSYHFLFVVGIVMMIFIYIQFYSIVSKLYGDMRDVIAYASSDKDVVIEDGDLGLLYEEIVRLKQRTKAYEATIQKEKDKLKQMMEDVCHQLKTPLTSIAIYNDLLMEGEIQQSYFIEIEQQLEKMKYLMNSLLKLAKLEGSQVKFDFQYLSIEQVFHLSLQSLHSIIQQNKVQVTIHSTDINLYYDESWMQEALSNIIKNSIEHASQNIDVSFEEHQKYVKIIIHNDGDEIDEKDLPHIFKRFYHSSLQGVGIGLSLSKEIIEKHHAHITAYNQDGVVFEIVFPLHQVNHKYKVS